MAESIQAPGGYQAVQLRVAEQYIHQFGNLAKESNTLILPATLSDVGSMIALCDECGSARARVRTVCLCRLRARRLIMTGAERKEAPMTILHQKTIPSHFT